MDKRAERRPLHRPIAISALTLVLGGTAALTAVSKHQDAANPEFSTKLRAQDEEAKNFLDTPFFQQEVGRAVAVNPPVVKNPTASTSQVLKIYYANCANCHGSDAMGGPMAPALVNLARDRRLSQRFLVDYLAGHKREAAPGSMPKFKQLASGDREQIADWLLTLNEPIQEAGGVTAGGTTSAPPQAFAQNCAICHGDRGEGNIGPSLLGVGSRPNRSKEDLIRILVNPREFGLKDPMPEQFRDLTEEDRKQIAEWLSKLK
jgi:mono/diheme cytochrome c family protein